MNYEYADAYLEVMCSRYLTNEPVLRRIKKSIIKTITQYEGEDGKPYVGIWIEGDTYYVYGTMEDFEKNSKTVFI